MINIHPTAIVDKGAKIGEDVCIGPYAIIENNVQIGNNSTIGSHVLIASGTRIGTRCQVHNGAVLGTNPQDLKFEDEETFLEIGNNTTIREYATLNRGTSHSIFTRIGDSCLIMAYAHIAHDCQIGNNVIMANSVNLAGHVVIEDFVGIGGVTPIHQFVRIGTQSFIGGGYRVPKDVPPYMLAMGEPLRYAGLNKTGLIRRGFSSKTLSELRSAYKILYRQNNTKDEAVKIMSEKYSAVPEVMHLVEFLNKSERGIIR